MYVVYNNCIITYNSGIHILYLNVLCIIIMLVIQDREIYTIILYYYWQSIIVQSIIGTYTYIEHEKMALSQWHFIHTTI